MIALVGHTSMQLAIAQCLQTSLIMFQATPPLAVVRSWNWTWRQFCSSSWPVLSKPSPNSGACPGSWFHSLHATSHALQPMQSVVSVKKPTVRAMVVLLSDGHEIRHELGEAVLLSVEVQRERDQFVHAGDRRRVAAHVYGNHVAPARLAGLRAQMGKPLLFGKDREPRGGLLATSRARHPLMNPARPAPAAQEHPRGADQGLAGVREIRHLGQGAAA